MFSATLARRFAAIVLPLCLSGGGAAAALEVRQVSPGIYRGPAPRTRADYRRLERLGIRTVLDLRKHNRFAVARERRALRMRGISHRHVPMGYRYPSDQTLARAVAIVGDPALQPVYVHCKQGQDRSGLIVGVYRVHHEGWSARLAYREMERHGFHARFDGLTSCFWTNCRDVNPRVPDASAVAAGRRQDETTVAAGQRKAEAPAAVTNEEERRARTARADQKSGKGEAQPASNVAKADAGG